jgi:hypothetical protein
VLVGLSALLIGMAFGFVAQRGGFCLGRGLSRLFIEGDASIVRAWGLALIVGALGVRLLMSGGLLDVPVRPFRWVAGLVGGLVFGVGIMLSGSCSAGAWTRLRERGWAAVAVIGGLAAGVAVTSFGTLAPVRQALQAPTLVFPHAAPTLDEVIGLSPWVVIGLLLVPVAWRCWSARPGRASTWPWPVTGAVVGVMVPLGWWSSSLADAPSGLSVASSTSHLFTYALIRYPAQITWGMILLLGVAAGALAGGWRATQPPWPTRRGGLVRVFAGGVLMGVGASVAEGCNVGQGLSQGATLALSSLSLWLGIVVGAWITVQALGRRRLARPDILG